MDSSGPRFHVRQLASRTFIVFVDGDLDHASADRLTQLVSDLLGDGAETLRFDLSGVVFLDAGGVRALVATVGLARDTGSALTFINPSDNVMKVLETAGVADMVDHADRPPAGSGWRRHLGLLGAVPP